MTDTITAQTSIAPDLTTQEGFTELSPAAQEALAFLAKHISLGLWLDTGQEGYSNTLSVYVELCIGDTKVASVKESVAISEIKF